MTSRTKLRFGALEAGRGVAAAVVVLYHTANIMSQPRFFDARPFGGHLENFNVGVDFFFVLSGFIITWVHWKDLGHPERLGEFARKRILRIYPPYLGVLLPLILLYIIFPGAGVPSQHEPANMLCSILLLPYPTQPVLGVAWTLTHEVFFYALFAAIIAWGRRWGLVLVIWACAIVVGQAFAPLSFPLSFFLSPFNLEFTMGVAAAVMLRRHDVPWPWMLMVAGAGAFAFLMLFARHIQDNPLLSRAAFGAAATLFVVGSGELERRRPWARPNWVAFFGASSYAIYLVHPVVLSALISLSMRAGGRYLSLDVAAVCLAVLAVAFGMLYHVHIERRLVRFADTRWKRHKPLRTDKINAPEGVVEES